MSSIEELKIIRLFRVYNTILQMCEDRHYQVRHPAVVAAAMKDPALYSLETGLRYDWFCDHFVISPVNIAKQLARRKKSTQVTRKSHERINTVFKHGSVNENDHNEQEAEEEENYYEEEEEQAIEKQSKRKNVLKKNNNDDDDEFNTERGEVEQRIARGEWIALRNAMRLTCITEIQTDANVNESTHKTLMVFFSATPALTIKEAQEFREKALRKSASSMIIVTSKVNPAVRREVQEMSGRLDIHTGKELLKMQLFEEATLTFNPARHTTVPPHKVLSPHEAEKLLLERQVQLSQLPRILENDPMVQYYGLSRGDIVKITRTGKESGPYDMFRQVIE